MAVRQSGVGGVTVVSGLDMEANLTITDGLWDNGVYQIINKYACLPRPQLVKANRTETELIAYKDS